MDWLHIFLEYVCPSLGSVMAALMFAAPVYDLCQALQKCRLGALNPVPWAVMTGNCLGWIAYGYYKRDPFMLTSNLPGLVLSFWLNHGASKLQYHQLCQELIESGKPTMGNREIITVPQEKLFLRVILIWCCILIWVGWVQQDYYPAEIIGICVNVNLVFFYGAPLESISRVIRTKRSDFIHLPTMYMNWITTGFWIAYGLFRLDPLIYVPNLIGIVLGIAQGVLVCIYPRSRLGAINLDDGNNNEGLVNSETGEEHVLV